MTPSRAAARETTRHGQLVDMRLAVEGNHVHLIFEFLTGDASGQNMATIATDAICRYIEDHTPIPWRHWFVEGNLSGDKKATMQSLMSVRGTEGERRGRAVPRTSSRSGCTRRPSGCSTTGACRSSAA